MEDSQRTFVPDEMLINIFERLPLKTIVRCTALNKSWYSTIKTPGLLKPHLLSSTSSSITGNFLILSYELNVDDDGNDEDNCFILSQDLTILRETFYFNFNANNICLNFHKVGSCCNGVICLSDIETYQKKSIYLFNPSIRKLRCINPTPLENSIKKPLTSVYRAVGFGYDKFTDDYKVIVINRRTCSDGTLTVTAEVYSLKTDSWKILAMRDYGFLSNDFNVSVNNATYWLRAPKEDEKPSIVSFDFSAEVFREFNLPDTYRLSNTHLLTYKHSAAISNTCLLTYNDSAAILEVVDVSDTIEDIRVNIWSMKEYGSDYSWKEELSRVHMPRLFYIPLYFTKTRKVIFWKSTLDLATWDPESGEVVDLEEFSAETCIIVEDYIKSLILL